MTHSTFDINVLISAFTALLNVNVGRLLEPCLSRGCFFCMNNFWIYKIRNHQFFFKKFSLFFFRPLINSNPEDALRRYVRQCDNSHTIVFSVGGDKRLEVQPENENEMWKMKNEKIRPLFSRTWFWKIRLWKRDLYQKHRFSCHRAQNSSLLFECSFEYSFECSFYKQHFRKRRVTYSFEICNPRCVFSNLAARSAYL